MTEANSKCLYLIDCSGLHELANTKSNSLKTLCIDFLSKGIISVPACVWQEFEELFEDEAAQLAPSVLHKVKMKKKYFVGAAWIADKSNPGFPLSPYDNYGDWYAASICSIEGYTLLTASSQLRRYEKMDCCKVADLATLTR
jgi:hypothetical protein